MMLVNQNNYWTIKGNYIYKKLREYKNCKNKNDYMKKAAKEGNKKIIKYIYKNYECSLKDLNMTFKLICKYGHLNDSKMVIHIRWKNKYSCNNE